jgi:nucleotide-binding universal stress UspA family protein
MNSRAITGNRLRDGAVVFYNDDAGWVERLSDASLYEDKATAEATLASAKAQAEKERLAVDVYAIEVRVEDGKRIPSTIRERIRSLGPTVRTDLGKQAAA